jgi:hypothetical protein
MYRALRQMKCRTVRDRVHKSSLNYNFLTNLLNMAMARNFEVMLGQTLNHCVQNSVILCIVS